MMMYKLVICLLLALEKPSCALQVQNTRIANDVPKAGLAHVAEGAISRRHALIQVLASSFAMASLSIINPIAARADVSDGNALPQGAAQFSRVLRLKTDLQGVKKRVSTGGNDIDKAEWDNIGRFLRTAYGISDDMKAIAGGIADPDKKKQALKDVELIRQYAQAGEIPVSKKSSDGLLPVLEKMTAIVEDFLDALSDVPDEI